MRYLVLAAAVAISNPCLAFQSGNELLEALNGDLLRHTSAMLFVRGNADGVMEGYHLGFKHAAGSSITPAKAREMIDRCIPPSVTNGQMADVVKKYLADNPAQRHNSPTVLIHWALSKAYPCDAK